MHNSVDFGFVFVCLPFFCSNELLIATFLHCIQMDVNKYCYNAAYGTKLYLVKEKIEDVPKTRAFYRRLRFLDISTKALLVYWIVKKILTYFDVSIY